MSTTVSLKRKLLAIYQSEKSPDDDRIALDSSKADADTQRLRQRLKFCETLLGLKRTPVEDILDELFIRDIADIVFNYLCLMIYSFDPITKVTVPRYVMSVDPSQVLERSDLESRPHTRVIQAAIYTSPVLSTEMFIHGGEFRVECKSDGSGWDEPTAHWDFMQGFSKTTWITDHSGRIKFDCNRILSFPLSCSTLYVPVLDVFPDFVCKNFSASFYTDDYYDSFLAKGRVENYRWAGGVVCIRGTASKISCDQQSNDTTVIREILSSPDSSRVILSRCIAGDFHGDSGCFLRSGFYYAAARGNQPEFSVCVSKDPVINNGKWTFPGVMYRRSAVTGDLHRFTGTLTTTAYARLCLDKVGLVPIIEPLKCTKECVPEDTLIDVPFVGPSHPLIPAVGSLTVLTSCPKDGSDNKKRLDEITMKFENSDDESDEE